MNERLVLPQDHFKRRVKNQYGDVLFAIAREVVQNSADAGATRVDFTVLGNGYRAQDNGCGMTLEEARKRFLHLGGTSKADGGFTGVFGAAKEVLALAHDEWAIRGQGFTTTGHGAGNIVSKPGGITRGFSIEARSPERKWGWMRGKIEGLSLLSNVSISIYQGGEKMPKGRKLRDSQLVKEYEFGKLYVVKNRLRPNEERGQMYVRSNGLFTCTSWIGGECPFVFYLELEGSSTETLTENRNYLANDVRRMVMADVQSIAKQPERLERRSKPKTVRLYGNVATFTMPAAGAGPTCAIVPTTGGNSTTHAEMGSLDVVDEVGPALWRRSFLMVDAKNTKMTTPKGNFRPMLKSTLEAWQHTIGLICNVTKISRPLVGLVCDDAVAGCHTTWRGQHAVCINPSQRRLSPFAFMSLAVHELAHMSVASHCQDYENARMAIDLAIGDSAEMVIHCVRGYLS